MEKLIHRDIYPKVLKTLYQRQIAIIYGARQTGKTTLARQVGKNFKNPLYLSCDDPAVVSNLKKRSTQELHAYIGNADLVVIDEAQRVENIGIAIKLLHDSTENLSILVTGSSSLDLANKISEPLTGRSVELKLYPFSIREIASNVPEMTGYAKTMMVRGGYPGVWPLSGEDASDKLKNIATNYIYRDAFSPLVSFDQSIINSLLQLLAFQIGSEVNYSELGRKLSINEETVKRYIDLLEKAFIVFRLNQYRKNLRAEVGRLRKVYFVDLGIRNALIGNFLPLEDRDDVGALWENFCVVERMKFIENTNRYLNFYYWRNKNKREIDLVESEGQKLHAYELKYGNKRPKLPIEYARLYPESTYQVVNLNNFNNILFEKSNPNQTRLIA